jgi:FAD-dependent urate hydroxylase
MGEVIIAGGGIAGPVTAMALQRAGIEATVYEAHDEPAGDIGLFLNVASNGLDALHCLGVDLAARADGHPIPRLLFFNGAGKPLGEVANGLTLADGTVSVCLARSNLQRILHDEARARGIAIHYGKRLVNVDDDGDRVAVGFADGSGATGHLLVGGDGIHSRVRQHLDPGGPAPSYTGMISLGGYSRVPDLMTTPDAQHFVFGRRAFFGYLVRDDGTVYWFGNIRHPETTTAELSTTSTAVWHPLLRRLFADDMPLIRQIISRTTGPIGAYPIHDVPTSRVWHRGRVVIVGDAAHATSPSAGQGASIGCEDALVLAQCLRDLPGHRSAFAAFERLRRGRVERVVAYSRKRGSTKTAGPVARFFRDLTMPFVLKHFASANAHAWLYDHHIDFDRPVTNARTD